MSDYSDSGYDDIDVLIDTDTIALGERCRAAEAEIERLRAESIVLAKRIARLERALLPSNGFEQGVAAERARCVGIVTDLGISHFGPHNANLNLILRRIEAEGGDDE